MVSVRSAGILVLALGLATTGWAAEPPPEPSFLHGAGQVVAGVVFELPKTVLDATLSEPPVVGTLAGLFAGAVRALQVTAAGLVEMATAFDPWSAKKRR